MNDEITLWVEFDLHRIIRENDRIMIRVSVPNTTTTGHLRAAALRMIKEMKHDVFSTEHFVLADIPQMIAKVTNAYPDKDGEPQLNSPLLSNELHEVAPRVYVPPDRRTEEAR